MAREPPARLPPMKILISYGGSFKDPQSPPATAEEGMGKARYYGGETRIISIDRRGINLRKLLARISELIPGALLSLPSDPPGLWLSHQLIWAADVSDDGGLGQILVPILEDKDVMRMIVECDRLVALGKPARLRAFLCDSEPSPTRRPGVMDSFANGSRDPLPERASSSSRTAFLKRGANDFPAGESSSCSSLAGMNGISSAPNVLQAITSAISDPGNLRKKTPEKHPAERARLANPQPAAEGSNFRGRSENLEPSIGLRTETLENVFPTITRSRSPGAPPIPQTIKLLHGRRTQSNSPPSNPPIRTRSGDLAESGTSRLPHGPSDTLPMGNKKAEAPITMEARNLAFLPTTELVWASKENPGQWPESLHRLGKENDSSIRDKVIRHQSSNQPVDLISPYLGSSPDKGTYEEENRASSPAFGAFKEQGECGNLDEHLSPASKADAKVQAGTSEAAEAPAKFPAVYSHLSTGQLQRIKSTDLEEIRELGSGSFGTVFHGKWKGSDVAIKRLKPSCFSGGDGIRQRLIADFWKEAHLLAQLHHPNLVSFYGVVTDGPGTSVATVTEFMVNGSLKQVLRRKDRTIDRRKRLIIAMDAAFGMEYLHEKGVVHFDLKSHNFLVNMRDAHRPVCKIGDLGLSKVKRRTLVSGGVRGTIPWMAPELLNPHTNLVTDKVDVYSFGIVMWELLTGEEPYEDMPSEKVIGGIIKGELRPEIPSWCEPTWRSLMERCWEADPAFRPPFSQISKELRAMAAAMNIL